MDNGVQAKKGRKMLVIGISVGLAIAIAVGVVVYLLISRDEDKDGKRNVVITQDDAERVLEDIDKQEVDPGYYTVTMPTTWHFKSGSNVSDNAVVENVDTNTNDVYFDIVEEGNEDHVIMKSPVIPKGGKLTDVTLDEALDTGTHKCVMIYHLVDENQNTLSTLRVGLTIVVD